MTGTGAFDVAAWRHMVAQAASGASPRIQAICPFGFEVTHDPRFIRRDLSRFYVYLGIPAGLGPPADWAVSFARSFGEIAARRAPDYWGVANCGPGDAVVRLGGGHRSIDIRAFQVDEDLLDVYARFVCTVPLAIADGLCVAPGMFDSEGTCRYFFQLSVMFHHLPFRSCGGELSSKEMETLSLLMREISARERATGTAVGAKSTPEQRSAVEEIVMPQTGRLRDHMRESVARSDAVAVRVQDINTPLTWEVTLPSALYEANGAALLHAYRHYGHGL
ncbi:hypothetical protein ACFV6E_03635 [Streptomyces sp. NPDC059785]|uniref:hypothetical protein n=1 Tax=Streptomyces sp. NPDC059785 TaxID=3346945 RepID=UPI00364D852F